MVGWVEKKDQAEIVNLFDKIGFISHSGKKLDYKIECNALSPGSIDCIAYIISKKYRFSKVIGVPRGGLKLAKALEKYYEEKPVLSNLLIVDDVLTTGNSMNTLKAEIERAESWHTINGVVIFARGKCPDWVDPYVRTWEIDK